ncbi:MAG: zinc ribbon domain-containing protein [Bacillota bacterium]|nr:zinc ribbon domain-containing protein [Bacillota bacterium]
MADIFEKISQATKNVAENVGKASKNAAEAAGNKIEEVRLNGRINDEKKRIELYKAQIGESVWQEHQQGKVYDGEVGELVAQIVSAYSNIRSIEDELEALKQSAAPAAPAAANAQSCPACGVAVGDGIKFCPNCGRPLSEPEPAPAAQPAAAVCPVCGVEVSGEYRFCPACGAPM